MIVVRVELHSAITGDVTELARAVIDNIGGTATRGDYRARTIKGRNREALQAGMVAVLLGKLSPVREGKVEGHARLNLHVWHLVSKALNSMGYGQ